MNKVIVIGGKNYRDYEVVHTALSWAVSEFNLRELVQRGGRGADALARRWAKGFGMWITTERSPAPVPIQNIAMIAGNKDAKCLLAFLESAEDPRVRYATSLGIKCFRINRDADNKVVIGEIVPE